MFDLLDIGDSKVCFHSSSCVDCMFFLTWSKCPKCVKSGSVSFLIDCGVKPAQDFKHPSLIACLSALKGVAPSAE